MNEEDQEERTRMMERVALAAQLLLLKRHRNPGVREWELKRVLGEDYRAVLAALSEKLSDLGLEVKEVDDGGTPRFLVTIRGRPPKGIEPALAGYRVDAVAALATAVAFVAAHGGKSPQQKIEEVLASKLSRTRARMLLQRFIDDGYLKAGPSGSLELGWRTAAEIDLKELSSRLISLSSERTSGPDSSSQPP
ncbi:MAG: hypothetical protein ACP5UI_02875 [Thermoprotei archaeon]|nr:hypothetical protein [TACK group archaeon]